MKGLSARMKARPDTRQSKAEFFRNLFSQAALRRAPPAIVFWMAEPETVRLMMESKVRSREALTKLTSGVIRFQSEIFPTHREAFEELQHGQEPLALFITCADSRVVPNLFTQTGPGELFIERNPGALVPGYGEFIGGVSASVEFAMLALEVPLIIVCAHTDCGVMKGLLNPQKAEGLPAVQQWMRHAMEARQRLLRDDAVASEKEKLRRLTEYSVLEQIENLKTHPSVAARIAKGEVEIRGWVYDIGKGEVRQADPESGRFEVLGA